jgi:hypothetical protein
MLWLCLPLVFSIATGAFAADQVGQSQSHAEKFADETANIVKDYTSFLNGQESPPTKQISSYTVEEYGAFAAPLHKLKQVMDSSKQETKASDQAIKEVGDIFNDGVFFDFLKIIDKRKKLEKLSVFIEESEKRAAKTQSDYKEWLVSSPDIDGISRKYLLETHYKNAEKNEFFRKETYKVKKKLTQELISLLDFLSKIYGTYEKGDNSQIICPDDHNVSILNAHFEAVAKFVKEEEKLTLRYKQYLMELAGPVTDQDPKKVQQQTTNTEKELKNIFKCFSDDESSKTISTSSYTTEEYGPAAAILDRSQQFMNLCKKEAILLDKEIGEAAFERICSEEVFFDLAKIATTKKKLENLCVVIDESLKRLEKYRSDLMQWLSSIPNLDDKHRKKLAEDFTKNEPILGKRSFAIRKEMAAEYIHLLNFLSIRYGTYKLINDKETLAFSSELEDKLYQSYIKKINKLFKEEEEISFLIEQRQREIFK